MSSGEELSPWGHALAGALGGVFSNAAVYPLDTIKTRIQAAQGSAAAQPPAITGYDVPEDGEGSEGKAVTKKMKSLSLTISSLNRKRLAIISSLMKVIKEEGIGGYYQGFAANMLNTFSMQYAYFFFYALVRATYNKRVRSLSGASLASPPPISTVVELILGALAGALAQIFTIPVAVIATRQQLDVPTSTDKEGKIEKVGFWGVAKEIVDEDGVQGLWRGIKPSLVLTVNPSITYGCFERIKGIVLKETGKEKLTPGTAFLVGAASKTLATVVTYPYIMAKVRLQAKYTPSAAPTSVDNQKEPPNITLPEEGKSYADATKPIQGEAAAVSASKEKKINSGKERYKSAVDVLTKVYKEKGLKGWYQGMSAQIIKAVLSQGILFMLKDQFEHYAFILMLLMGRAESAAIKAIPTV